MAEGEADLSEEFLGKAKTIFESAVVAKVNEEIDRLEAEFKQELAEAIQTISNELAEKVDGYLGYVVEQWMKENELAIERGVKSEVTEDFIQGLKALFEEHYIDLPEDKVDVVEALAEEVEELKTQLNSTIEINTDVQKQLDSYKRDEIVNELSNGLADTEIEKLKSLTEGVEFEDADQFRDNVTTIKSNYFPKVAQSNTEETVEHGMLNENLTPSMSAYTCLLYTSPSPRDQRGSGFPACA